MTTKIMINSVFAIATSALLGGAARADVISIDFDHVDYLVGRTESGINTDFNGHTSLPGQVGVWNVLVIGDADYNANWQYPITNKYTISSLKNGDGAVTSVSLDITNGVQHAVYSDDSTDDALHRDWMTPQAATPAIPWKLTGLEPSTVYRLRMFGREQSTGPVTFATFTATGATSDTGFTIATRNYVDLWVKSTAGGVISGTLDKGPSAPSGAWSGMQIEWDTSYVISMDFDMASVNYNPGPTASGTVADLNGDLSMPGQLGTWNAVLMGNDYASSWNVTNNEVKVVGLLDGGGDATAVSFNFNTGKATYTAFSNPYGLPNRTALHRDVIYSSGALSWQIDGLQPSAEYTLKFFGFQETAGTRLFANFSATGLNTASGTTSASQNWVDLVVTSTVLGQITGQKSLVNGSWSGMQIQGSQPFLKPNPNLISIDFDKTETLPTQSALNIDANGHTSLPGQSGAWNSILMPGAWAASITSNHTSATLKNGAGVDTAVSLVINPTNSLHWTAWKPDTSHLVQRDFLGNFGGTLVDWNLSGLEASTFYRLRMFGREDANVPISFARFTAYGATTNTVSTYPKRNQADLWVTSTAGGTISGTLGGAVWGQAGSWSGMQIERNDEMPASAPVISIDFGYADGTPHPGPVASWTQVDKNGDQSLPGQFGDWNELLTGTGATNTSNNTTVDTPNIGGLLDGEGAKTTVSFAFNTGKINYTTYAGNPAHPNLTALHRDCVYITPAQGTADWQITGLAASTECTLRFFGYQGANGPGLFADFSATGINTALGTTSLFTNYVDLVVTSTVNGVITGTVKRTGAEAAGSLSGIQIQASGSGALFPTNSNLISLDFETADTLSKTPTATGTISDSNGDTSFGQDGVWNSLISGVDGNGNWHATTMQPSINNMFDGLGNATTVAFQYNTGTPVSYNVYSGAGALLGDMFVLLGATGADVSWKLTGLQPYAYYTLRMFGQVGSNPSLWEAYGAEGNTASDTNTSTKNYVDLTVPANGAGEITGKQKMAGSAGASWSGMQILKLTDDPYVPTYVPTGTVILIN